MALTLVTGQPGHGKSLWTVFSVDELRKKENREVYYVGIKGLALDWKPLPLLAAGEGGLTLGSDEYGAICGGIDWAAVPDGALVVIDEAWNLFPTRRQGAAIPAYVQFLATHRHHGLDIYFVTQQIKTQVDTFVRGLIGRHIHVERKFNAEVARKFEWPRVADPSSAKDRADSQNELWPYPKSTYGVYKSATVHTVRRTLPWKKVAAGVVCLVLGGAFVGWALFRLKHSIDPKDAHVVPASSAGHEARGEVGHLASYWGASRDPRVVGVEASAQIYDGLQKARTQPRAEGCLQLAIGPTIRCECTGPGGRVLSLTIAQCLSVVKLGVFDETRAYPDVKAENIARLEKQSAAAASMVSESSNSASGSLGTGSAVPPAGEKRGSGG